MLRHSIAHSLLIAAVVASAGSLAADESSVSLPSRISFQAEAFRHESKDEPRALWLARLAAEGRRPVRLAWRSEAPGSETPIDPFARLSLDLRGTPTLLPLHVAEPERWTRVMESLAASSTCPCTVWEVNPGRVPDGDVLLGTLLRASKNGGNVILSWGSSCSDAAADYTIHEGTLGTWYSHEAVACTTNRVTSATVTPGAGRRYFLVVPVTADAEGSYGLSSAGVERPKSPVGCRDVWVTQRCP